MRDFAIVFVHLIVTLVRLARPGGLRSVVAESVLVRHQLLILNRGRKRAPNLHATDWIIAGLCTLFMRPARVLRSAIVVKPSTLLHLHSVLRKRKYRMLFSPRHLRRPGPKGVWSKNPIHMKSKGDGSGERGGPDGSVTPRYMTKKSPRNVGMASSKPARQYLVFSARSSFCYTGI